MTVSHEAKSGVVPIPRVKSEKKPAKPLRAKPRSKGARAEREIVDILRLRGYSQARRNWMSGGAGGSDFIEGIPGYGIEAKHRETVKLREWLAQAAEACSPTETPLLVHRVNRRPWRASLPDDDLTPLLQLNGSPRVFRLQRESGRLKIWDWIDQAEADCAEHAGSKAIPLVTYAWPGTDGRWYTDLLFDTLLDLIAEASK